MRFLFAGVAPDALILPGSGPEQPARCSALSRGDDPQTRVDETQPPWDGTPTAVPDGRDVISPVQHGLADDSRLISTGQAISLAQPAN